MQSRRSGAYRMYRGLVFVVYDKLHSRRGDGILRVEAKLERKLLALAAHPQHTPPDHVIAAAHTSKTVSPKTSMERIHVWKSSALKSAIPVATAA